MHKIISSVNNEKGSMIIFTMMVLTLLTLVGLAAINTANTEIEIAGSELIYQRNFYLAEGAAMEAADYLDNNLVTSGSGPSWLELTPGIITLNTVDDYWDTATAETSDALDPDGDTKYLASFEGVSAGSSLDMAKSKLHDITIYGHCSKRGVSDVVVGYRVAF